MKTWTHHLAALVVALGLTVAGCGRGAKPAADEHAGEKQGDEAHHEHTDGIRRIELHDVRGVSFRPVGEPREEAAWLAAEAVADVAAATAISSPVAGVVTAVRVEPGARVAAGQAVVEIRSPELADAKAAWLGARARRSRAELDLERERRLLAAAATSPREVEAAEAEAAVAQAEEEAARLSIEARGLRPESAGTGLVLRAPRAGIVAELPLTLGQGVSAGQELARLVAPGAALVQVELPLPGPPAWSAGARTQVRHADGRRWTAIVEGVPPALSEATRRLTYRLRLAPQATDGELPLAGTPLEAQVPLARAVVLPQTALQQVEGSWGVFVRDGEDATFRPVEKGPELGGDVLVLSGVQPGEAVATEGAYLLKSLYLKLQGGGEDHDH